MSTTDWISISFILCIAIASGIVLALKTDPADWREKSLWLVEAGGVLLIAITAFLLGSIKHLSYSGFFTILLLIFFVFGVLFTILIKKNEFREGLLLHGLLTCSLGALGFYLLILVNKIETVNWLMTTSVIAFLIPVIGFLLQNLWEEIPAKIYSYWSFPEGRNPPSFPSGGLISLLLDISYQPNSSLQHHKLETVPWEMKLGDFFHYFIEERNDQLQALDQIQFRDPDSGILLGWQFQLKNADGSSGRILDPQLSLRENLINNHSEMIAQSFVPEAPTVADSVSEAPDESFDDLQTL